MHPCFLLLLPGPPDLAHPLLFPGHIKGPASAWCVWVLWGDGVLVGEGMAGAGVALVPWHYSLATQHPSLWWGKDKMELFEE